MQASFTCKTCGKEWPENYCPECFHTIDRPSTVPPVLDSVNNPGGTAPPLIAGAPPPLFPPTHHVALPVSHERPTVVTLYRVWCALILIVYAAFGVQETLTLAGKIPPRIGVIADIMSRDDPALHGQLMNEERSSSFIGLAMAIVGVALFATGAFHCPRRPWAWIWGIVAIIVSIFPLCVTIAGAIPLLIYWCKPGPRRYFNG